MAMLLNQGSDWAWLPEHLLDSILERLPAVSDYVRFATVCKHWLSVALFHRKNRLKRRQPPMLLIPTHDSSDTCRSLYSIIGNRVLDSRLHVPYNTRCCGSSYGWLIFADETLALTLFNPFTGATIRLPPVAEIPSDEDKPGFYSPPWYVTKVVLSDDPALSPNDYKVLALYEYMGELALFRSGDQSWIHVSRPETIQFRILEDIIYYEGKFYITAGTYLACIELSSRNSAKLRLLKIQAPETRAQRFYIVKSSNGELLHVERFYFGNDPPCYGRGFFKIDNNVHEYRLAETSLTSKFVVHKMSFQEDGTVKYQRAETLDNEALFVGTNHSMSIPASVFAGCEPNGIYYTDDDFFFLPRRHGAIDIGVFNLAEKWHPKPLYAMADHQRHMPPPIWIEPRANLISVPYSF